MSPQELVLGIFKNAQIIEKTTKTTQEKRFCVLFTTAGGTNRQLGPWCRSQYEAWEKAWEWCRPRIGFE